MKINKTQSRDSAVQSAFLFTSVRKFLIGFYLWDALVGIGDKLLTEIYNPLLDEVSDSLIRILHRFDLFGERFDCLLRESWPLLLGKVVVDFLHNLHGNGRQDFQ